MDNRLIDLSPEQIEEIEERLSAYDKEHITYELSGNVSIGICRDGKLIAGADGCMTTYRIFYLSTLFVDPQYRRQGIGRELMEAVEQRAVALGANLIRLDTFDWQGATFYQRLGYEQVGCYTNEVDHFSEYFFLKRIGQ